MKKYTLHYITLLILLMTQISLHAAIIISEIYYHPLGEGVIDGDEYEFIELKNTGTSPVALSGYAFTAGIKYSFPASTTLQADSFVVLAWNAERFAQRYGFQPFGVFTGHLDNNGEKITLSDTVNSKNIISFQYATVSPWPQAADGAGFSLVPKSISGTGDPSQASYWRTSARLNGSPAKNDLPLSSNILPVYVNEVLTHTDPPLKDAVELYNPNDVAVDIGSWHLSDKIDVPLKYSIPEGTTIEPHGYMVFDEDDFNADSLAATSFKFSELGDGAYIFSADSEGNLNGYSHGFEYGAIDNGVSFGRYLSSDGKELFTAMQELTLGAPNSSPLLAPLAITEICYNAAGGADFIELRNITDVELALYDKDRPDNTWRVNGISFSFPLNVVMQPGELVIVVSDTVTTSMFRSLYNIPDSIRIFSFAGTLSSNGEKISIDKPLEPSFDGIDSLIPYMEIDVVNYGTGTPGTWPLCQLSMSICKSNPLVFGNDPAQWEARLANPGIVSAVRTFHKGSLFNSWHVYYNSKNRAINFTLAEKSYVSFSILTLTGRSVYSFSSLLNAGQHSISTGSSMKVNGSYLVKIQSGQMSATKLISFYN